jgi:hypothetical protein
MLDPKVLSRAISDLPAAALVLILGFLALIAGAVGASGLTFGGLVGAATNREPWYFVLALGIIFEIVGMVAYIRKPNLAATPPVADDYGIKILSPPPGMTVDWFNISGKITGTLPDGYELRLANIWQGGQIRPLNSKIDSKDNQWLAINCFVNAESGQSFDIGVYLVGPIGSRLFDYFLAAAVVHAPLRLTAASLGWQPLPAVISPDIVKSDQVHLIRK